MAVLIFCGNLQADVPRTPLSNAEIEKVNAFLKQNGRNDLLCVAGHKFKANNGYLYLVKCRADGGQYFAVGITERQPSNNWSIEVVKPVTDED